MSKEMTSNRPYLLRALFEWISDNQLTPHILVEAGAEGVDVPEQAVQKGKVILNIDHAAVRDLDLGNFWLTFKARFSGNEHNVSVPIEAVLAIYARENGQGMMFAQEEETPPPTDPESDPDSKPAKRPHLTIVK
ncbi:MAG: ClpXP protease specificity-enhancing factor [Gammaproteobacteria bacterium]|nr:ClpXP protease specificity-enhancing factor [Gammaproteobacteria bacterium]